MLFFCLVWYISHKISAISSKSFSPRIAFIILSRIFFDITENDTVIKEKEDNALKLEQEEANFLKSDRIKDVATKTRTKNNATMLGLQ